MISQTTYCIILLIMHKNFVTRYAKVRHLFCLEMVRNYKRKTSRGDWTEENMKLAIIAVESKELSIRKAAVVFGVPKDSLNRRVKGKLKSLSGDEKHKNVLGRDL